MATFSANTYYATTNERQGSFTGGTWTASLGNVPHPAAITTSLSTTGDTVIDVSAVLIGGFNGLNN